MAVALLAIAVVDFFLMKHLGLDGEEPMLIRTWRLFLTGLLSFFLALGKNSARWITVFLTGLGSLAGVYGLAIVLASGEVPSGDGYLILGWLVILTLAYGFIASFLAYSTGVSREIRRIAERIE